MTDDLSAAADRRQSHLRRTRRTFHAMTALALVVAGAAVGTAAMAADPPTTNQQEQGMHPGRPFHDPVNADSDAKHNVNITLDSTRTQFEVGGKKVYGASWTGSFVAPTIRVKPGDTLTVHLVNNLPVATNLHFHGLHVSPQGQSDDPFLCVAPGASTTYTLAIPADHPQGTFWYHSHAMGTSCSDSGMSGMSGMAGTSGTAGTNDMPFMPGDVENQISDGLSGALIVGDDRTLLPADLQQITAHTLVLKDAQVGTDNHLVQNTAAGAIDSNAPTVRTVNGQLRPVLSMRPNETQLWRLVNAGADIFYQLQLDGYRFTVVGEDGTPVSQVTTADTLLLPPGKRYDVLVTANGNPGRTTLRTLAYSNGPDGDSYPDTELATVNVAGHSEHRLPLPTGGMPTAPADLSAVPVAQHRDLVLSEKEEDSQFFINGKQFAMGTSVFDTPAKLGTVEEWTITNAADEDHPFHLHTTAFQVVSINGVPQPYTHRQDTVPVPHEQNGVPGKVVIRINFADYEGAWMFHCHIAAHEDNGMMSFINVVR
ncbi:multicopper oxidase family protein [Kitasatospora sp. NPDC058965]|uniref:multicopper oxidase family protein n=1 Tax=Kitasatospora sp. NPDC058965 TaxID=3346682 RepID=UPI003686523D